MRLRLPTAVLVLALAGCAQGPTRDDADSAAPAPAPAPDQGLPVEALPDTARIGFVLGWDGKTWQGLAPSVSNFDALPFYPKSQQACGEQLVYHRLLRVLGEEVGDGAGDDSADVGQAGEDGFGDAADVFQRAECLRQRFGGAFADVADAERE